MMGRDSIDVGLGNIWKSWFFYRKGKKLSRELLEFQAQLEENLYRLCVDLQKGDYRHGGYRTFVVSDNKRREVSVAGIRDRVVHRLLYDYLTRIYDRTFIYDAWSCRVGKGLAAAIERAQDFFHSYPHGFVWRCDIRKFFDTVDHKVLLRMLVRRVADTTAFDLLEKVIRSFSKNGAGKGMPIGNLTSQIFANIYLNEMDRFITHELKAKPYLRYGDDFLVFSRDHKTLAIMRAHTINFLGKNLRLRAHPQNNFIHKTKQGIIFLGVEMYPYGRKLTIRNRRRVECRLNHQNAGSYFGFISRHGSSKIIKEFHWRFFTDVF